MNALTKIAAVALAALTLTVGTLATSNEAQAFPKKGFIGVGIAAAVIGTAIAVATSPRCQEVERYDRRGNYRGTMQVCD